MEKIKQNLTLYFKNKMLNFYFHKSCINLDLTKINILINNLMSTGTYLILSVGNLLN